MAGTILDILIFVIVLDLCASMFIPEKELALLADTNPFRNTLENSFNMMQTDVDNSLPRIHARPIDVPNSHSSYMIIREDPNTGRLTIGTQTFGDALYTLQRKQTHDDADSKTLSKDTNIPKTDFYLQSFISDFERYSGKSANTYHDLVQNKDFSSDHRTEKRVYGIEDFVNDFLKIVSNTRFIKDGIKF